MIKNLVRLFAVLLFFTSAGVAAAEKPNILVIFGDDVGMWNISAYHNGMMGGRTPNIDRIAKEGAIFAIPPAMGQHSQLVILKAFTLVETH